MWKKCSLNKAFLFMQGKKLMDKMDLSYFAKLKEISKPEIASEILLFTDGTAIACKSNWSGPYSQYTPDIDAEPPIWWKYQYANDFCI